MGAAFANFVAWAVYLVMGLWTLTRKNTTVRLRLKNIRFDKNELIPILRVGVPSALQMGMYSVANVMISATVNAVGAQATTGVGIANIFDGVLYNICYATSLAVLPYVSQNVGAGNVKRAAKSVWRGILITVCIGVFFGSLSAIFSRQLASFMADSEEIIWYARQKMIIISSTYFICGINDIICAAMRGLGKPTIPTVVSLFSLCGLRFAWVFFVYPLMPGDNLTFLYLVWPLGWLLSIVVLLPFYFARLKKLKEEHQPNPAIEA
jgi:Na+-driven multidrug efflux pump